MPIQWIIFNGPKRSGKSSAAMWLARAIRGINDRLTPLKTRRQFDIRVDSINAPMRHFLAASLGERYQEMDKEKARPELFGRSVRELEDNLMGMYMKERFGDDMFARLLVHRNLKAIPIADYIIVDDGEFEADRYVFTKPRIIHLDRPNAVFAPGACFWSSPWAMIVNDKTHEDMYSQVTSLAKKILQEDGITS